MLLSNPEHIIAIFKATKQAGAKPATSMALRRAFGASVKAAKYWDADDSGIAVQPRKAIYKAPNERLILALEKQLNAEGIQEQRTHYPDLYAFVQSVVGRSATKTLMGPYLLELSPDILDDFQIYDKNLLKFLFGWPRCLARGAYQARDRLLMAVEKWHTKAHKKASENVDKIAPEDPEFDAYFGFKLIRARQSAMMKMGVLDDRDRATPDLGLMFALENEPFLWARHSIFNRKAAFIDEAWNAMGHSPGKPLAIFDAERFLVAQDINATTQRDEPTFSLEGLAGCWLPFRGGQRMCSGRHFTKSRMLGTFAMLFTRYELELAPGVGDVKPDLKWYPTGTLPPSDKVLFRIRMKVGVQI
ncbi:hypothetical protein M406DRAFT_73632 [Cryphonectria parasitica EP155]|uniref:Cytochrome P450 n=1 Tax=Cryphonectria parasitica (strain ATCC 38755 / EP155) TaxID=660469 RepID=A0A9P4XTY5_CRYP1|nr:uncharacterized protein M406DRAFT_73632 [Cryphonectria parasitica EP155]KAF3761197.1 hypothetical protein M406DRAFT_73632 [Cryphonectria parasitica EP155]